MKIQIPLIALFFTFHFISHATIIQVPADYPAIQAAILASADGDTVLVAPGTYFENLNFRGHQIMLTSMYYLNLDTSYITSTIINGSQPVYPDTASCVIFNSGEDSTTILQGFTITGGAGTKWSDIHGAGNYREGGGILVELSSPTIMHNIIQGNAVTNTVGVTSTGGGGIRIGDSNPIIQNNIIINNQARYGPGIVLNYTGVRIRNNVIAFNTGGQNYNGGSGIWMVGNLSGEPILIHNNTIVNNSSSASGGTGGILVWSSADVELKNNIIWGNFPSLQVKVLAATPEINYNDINGSYAGAGNIALDPLFESDCYLLSSISPCIDAGDSTVDYNDHSTTPNTAILPSKGTFRNDIGAYGGPYASYLNCIPTLTNVNDLTMPEIHLTVYPNPGADEIHADFYLQRASKLNIKIEDILGNLTLLVYQGYCYAGNHSIPINMMKLTNGTYFFTLTSSSGIQEIRKLVVIK